MRTRRKGPLQTLSDAQVLRLIARNLKRRAALASKREPADDAIRNIEREVLLDGASRLYCLARRVPLWTDRRS